HNSLDHSTSRHLPGYPPPAIPQDQQYRQEVIQRSSSQPTQETYTYADLQTPLSESDDRQMRYYFPLDTQEHLRRALFHVLNSAWKHHNEREPTDEILLQFTQRTGKLYRCLFHKQEGQQCPKEFDRKDRALDHIRTHIDLQPFCCRETGW
ncbi:12391_t:CDS:1, partial [Acaulospora colombiana]